MVRYDRASLERYLLGRIEQIHGLTGENELAGGYRISQAVCAAVDFYRRYWEIDLSGVYPSLIAAQPAYPLMAAMIARQLKSAQMYDAAALVAGTVSAFNIPGNVFQLLHAAALREAGRISSAREIASHLLAVNPADGDAASELAECDVAERFSSMDYYDVLHVVHRQLRPKSYLEIGVAQGRSLALVRGGTAAVGVDPDTGAQERIFFHSPENEPQLFRLTSDSFFASRRLPDLLGQPTVDVAFLDGLHHFDQTLRDFINVEKYAGRDTVILIHDCLPVNPLVAERERRSVFWLGDVWKIIPCLRALRPDLEITTLPVGPSGLAVIRSPDPESRVLERQFDRIVQHFTAQRLPESWDDICRVCAVTEQSVEQVLALR